MHTVVVVAAPSLSLECAILRNNDKGGKLAPDLRLERSQWVRRSYISDPLSAYSLSSQTYKICRHNLPIHNFRYAVSES